MIVLGIDPGIAATGYGLVRAEGGLLHLERAGVLRAPPRRPLAERLRHLCDGLEALLQEAPPDCLAMEGIFTGRNVRSSLTMAHLRGAYLLTSARHGLEVAEYAPRQVKQAVTGHGGADKQQVREMVRRLVRAPAELPLALDASDALAVAICHAHSAAFAARLAGAR